MSGVELETVLNKLVRVKIDIIKIMKIMMNTLKTKEDTPNMKTHS